MLIDGQNGFILKERDIVKENPFIDFSAIKLNLHIICTCQYLYRTVWLVSPYSYLFIDLLVNLGMLE